MTRDQPRGFRPRRQLSGHRAETLYRRVSPGVRAAKVLSQASNADLTSQTQRLQTAVSALASDTSIAYFAAKSIRSLFAI